MKTNIYFVRHGEAVNPDDIWYGRLPGFALSEKGKKEIEQAAEFLSDKNIKTIYSSPLLRTKQSAEIIRSKLNLPLIHFSRNLLEVKSSLQGRSFTYIRSINFNVFAHRGSQIIGETIEEMAKRMQKFIAHVTRAYKGKNIVVVGHGDPIMIVKAMIQGLPIKNESLRPGGEKYIQHGEIYLAEFENSKSPTIRSVFKPLF